MERFQLITRNVRSVEQLHAFNDQVPALPVHTRPQAGSGRGRTRKRRPSRGIHRSPRPRSTCEKRGGPRPLRRGELRSNLDIAERLRRRKPLGDVERAMGIEPTSVAWEATALPLSYARVAVGSLCAGPRVAQWCPSHQAGGQSPLVAERADPAWFLLRRCR